MTCYCGCATTGGKVRWAVAASFSVLAVIVAGAWIHFSNAAGADMQKIADESGPHNKNPCVVPKGEQPPHECIQLIKDMITAYLCFFVFVGMLVGATVPCYMMCCCSTPPRDDSRRAHQAAPVAPQAVAADSDGDMQAPLLQQQRP